MSGRHPLPPVRTPRRAAWAGALLLAPLLLPASSAAQEPATAEGARAPVGDSVPVPPPAASAVPAGMLDLVEASAADHRMAGPLDDLKRVAELLGIAPADSRLIRRLSRPDSAPPARAVLGLMPAGWRVVYNSAYPRTGNDGLLWAGRGTSTSFSAGARVRWGPVSAALAPEVAWQRNADFEIRKLPRPGYSQYAYPYYNGIDYPQRMGPDPYASAGLGGSHVRVDAFGAAAGVSAENLWWGPATRYPILMGSTAGGFPHVFVGTSGPLPVWIGRLEAELVWGGLNESGHYDQDLTNDQTMFIGVVAAFSPRGLDGLTIGGARVYQYMAEGDGWSLEPIALRNMFRPSKANRPGNELASLFARWVVAPGAEVYGEWARDDRYFDVAELLQEPDHSQAFLVGVQKVTRLRDDVSLRVQFEAVALQHLGELRDSSRPTQIFYTHSAVRQGYTNGGQLLGAWIGPGGDAQYLAADALTDFGIAGLYLERVRRADASSAALQARRWWPYEHDTEITVGLRALSRAWKDVSVAASLSRSYRFNRDFLDRDDVNWGLSIEASWTPGPKFR